MSADAPRGEPGSTRHVVIFMRGEERWTQEVDEGVTLFDAARSASAPVETLCHGVGACVRCKVKVVEGSLTPPTPLERDRLGNIFHLTRERLSCQAQVCGPVSLEISAARRKRRSRRS